MSTRSSAIQKDLAPRVDDNSKYDPAKGWQYFVGRAVVRRRRGTGTDESFGTTLPYRRLTGTHWTGTYSGIDDLAERQERDVLHLLETVQGS